MNDELNRIANEELGVDYVDLNFEDKMYIRSLVYEGI